MAYKPASLNPFSPDFRLSACDGPTLPREMQGSAEYQGYTPCDFSGLMLQINHFISIMIVLGVLAAIITASYAGFQLITGGPDKKNSAKDMLQKTGWGFIMMLSAWFIVSEILNWLSSNASAVKALIGA